MRKRRNDDEHRTVRVLLSLPISSPPFPTSLVERCEAALDTPLGDLTLEQLRLLISQGFGPGLVVPKALEILERDPLISVTFYEGDLLAACLGVPFEFWQSSPALADRLKKVSLNITSDEKPILDARREFLEALGKAA